jgi:hypothetical protein
VAHGTERLAEAVVALLNDAGRRDELGRAAARYTAEHLSAAAVYGELLEYLDTVAPPEGERSVASSRSGAGGCN